MNPFIAARIEESLLGPSRVMQDLKRRILRVAKTDLAVMIEGPTGSGKELVAQALHLASACSGECIAVNVCAISDGMFEDTMFGHARGAFTGAVNDHAGLFTEAHRGTLFLDEIGGLSLQGQAKLLRAIETRRFRPVGARADQTSEFRVVAASNISLQRLIIAGAFRQDLAERLRGIRLVVPALADREQDALFLAMHFATGRAMTLTRGAQRFVERFGWPGNVRQLRNAIDCASLLVIDDAPIDEALMRDVMETSSPGADADQPAASVTRAFQDRRTVSILRETGGNVVKASALLGIHRATLYRRLDRMQVRATPSCIGAPVSPLGEEAAHWRVTAPDSATIPQHVPINSR